MREARSTCGLWSAVGLCVDVLAGLLGLLFLLLILASPTRAAEPLPLVTESVDEVIVIHLGENSTRLVFLWRDPGRSHGRR